MNAVVPLLTCSLVVAGVVLLVWDWYRHPDLATGAVRARARTAPAAVRTPAAAPQQLTAVYALQSPVAAPTDDSLLATA